ncbi:MAG: hypothetical protein HPY59_10325 [Anaerolineae bacterium]|nr:hypothetical protein [Anaerolineae bacterium]
MTVVEVINQSQPQKLAIKAEYCDSFWKRLKGLMLKPSLNAYEGILLAEKKASITGSTIHMFFMNFDIAVVWLDAKLRVVDTAIAKRWRPYYAPSQPAKFILETHASHIGDFKYGDQISLEND